VRLQAEQYDLVVPTLNISVGTGVPNPKNNYEDWVQQYLTGFSKETS
jgi:hypothetical protein